MRKFIAVAIAAGIASSAFAGMSTDTIRPSDATGTVIPGGTIDLPNNTLKTDNGESWKVERNASDPLDITPLQQVEAMIAAIPVLPGAPTQTIVNVIGMDTYDVTAIQAGAIFISEDVTRDVLFNLPVVAVGTSFTFVNTTTRLLKLNAVDGQAIDDSDTSGAYELYSGSGNGVNRWPWSSVTITLVRPDWWHVVYARGDWTSTGTTPSGVPASVRSMDDAAGTNCEWIEFAIGGVSGVDGNWQVGVQGSNLVMRVKTATGWAVRAAANQ